MEDDIILGEGIPFFELGKVEEPPEEVGVSVAWSKEWEAWRDYGGEG